MSLSRRKPRWVESAKHDEEQLPYLDDGPHPPRHSAISDFVIILERTLIKLV